MIKSLLDILDFKVLGVASIPVGLTLADWSHIATIASAILAAAYTLYRWRKSASKKNDKEETDL